MHIFDDCSTDSTVELLKEYNDSRLNIILSPKNVGTYAGKNYVLKQHCSQKFVGLHDSDDWSEKERFEKQINFMLKNNAVCLGTAVKEIIISSDHILFLKRNLIKKQEIISMIMR